MNTTFFPKTLTKKVPSKIAQKKGTTVIMLIIFVLIVLVISVVIGAAVFYGAGARAEKAGEEPFSTLAKVQEKLAGNFPDLQIDTGTFQITCMHASADPAQNAITMNVVVQNLGKKVAESPETEDKLGGFFVCETLDGEAQISRVGSIFSYAAIPQLQPAGKKGVEVKRFVNVCPIEVTTTINADCMDWIDEGNEDNNEIVRICKRNEATNAGCINGRCTYACRAP